MKYLALDIGNVCLKINPINCLRKLGIVIPPPQLFPLATAFECGEFGEEEFFAAFRRLFPKRDETEEMLRDAFNSILIGPVSGMVEQVKSLPGKGIQPVFFSDVSMTHLRRFRELFSGASDLPGIYSFEVGALKPSPKMFDAFERGYGRPVLYLDDRADLIAAARERGWNARQFSSPADLSAVGGIR